MVCIDCGSIIYRGVPYGSTFINKSNTTIPPFTIFLSFATCDIWYGNNRRKKERNHNEWPPTIIYSSWILELVENMNWQNSIIRLYPFVENNGLFPMCKLVSVCVLYICWKLHRIMEDDDVDDNGGCCSNHDACIVVLGGVIHNVSGFELISCNDGTINILSV